MSADSTPRVRVLVVDEDRSPASERLVRGLRRESALTTTTRPEAKAGEPAPAEYTAATAETAVKRGTAPAALIVPAGFGANVISFTPGSNRKTVRILHDSSNPVAAQMVAGLLQKVAMTSLSGSMAELGMQYFAQASGGLTPQQRQNIETNLAQMRDQSARRDAQADAPAAANGEGFGGLVAVEMRDVVGENKRSPMIAFYAAGIGVMFLMFTASAAGGTLLDEADSGALDRILSARVSMTTLLAGKLTYCMLLACPPTHAHVSVGRGGLSSRPVHAPARIHRDDRGHLVRCGGIRHVAGQRFAYPRAQPAAVATLLILTMSAIGGSMFPRFLCRDPCRKWACSRLTPGPLTVTRRSSGATNP